MQINYMELVLLTGYFRFDRNLTLFLPGIIQYKCFVIRTKVTGEQNVLSLDNRYLKLKNITFRLQASNI